MSRAPTMADARKSGSKKGKGKDATLEDEHDARWMRLTLILYLLGGAAIISGMVVLSEFLSKGKAENTVLIVAGSLFGVLAIGIVIVVLLRRQSK